MWLDVRNLDRLGSVQREEVDPTAQNGQRGIKWNHSSLIADTLTVDIPLDKCSFYHEFLITLLQALGEDVVKSLHGLTVKIGNPKTGG